jgi:hypothetical protein
MKPCNPEEWMHQLAELSIPYHEHGSFLFAQERILRQVILSLNGDFKSVSVFVAPPASGKTHAICLVARFLADSSFKVAIIVPSVFLKLQFKEAAKEVVDGLGHVDILTIAEYLKATTMYDYVLTDEAHNLKSFSELDPRITRTIEISPDDDAFEEMMQRFLPPGKDFLAKQLSHPSAIDVLKLLRRVPRIRIELHDMLQSPTKWKYFIYVWKDPSIIMFKATLAGASLTFKMPRKKMLMFSASPLTNGELEFYCGITSNQVQRFSEIRARKETPQKCKYIYLTDSLNLESRSDLTRALLEVTNVRTLVLLNSKRGYQEFTSRLSNVKRIFWLAGDSGEKIKR